MATTDDLTTLVLEAIDADDSLDPDAGLVVMAAMEGDAALDDLAGFARPEVPPPSSEAEEVEPAGAFLDRITVSGFRGIGSEVTLPLTPGPGLTVVAGRNGSGKSTFCEALEVALTGRSARWSSKASVTWRDAWRNLHHPTACIDIVLAEEGAGTTTVRTAWADDADLKEETATVQRAGKPREDGRDSLGWTAALETYRPILTYDELGEILSAKPSALYDKLSMILGLEQISDAITRIADRVKTLSEPKKALSTRAKELTGALAASTDDRAAAALTLVKARQRDVQALEKLASGGAGTADQTMAALRRLTEFVAPTTEAVDHLTTALRQAAAAREAARGPADEALERRIAVITAALEMHHHDGDMTCPVCGTGTLDATAVERLGEGIATDRAALLKLRDANAAVDHALRAARDIIPRPIAIGDGVLPDTVTAAAHRLMAVLGRWDEWASATTDPSAMADGIAEHFLEVDDVATTLVDLARTEMTERDDAWAPLAARLGEFARQAAEVQRVADELKAHEQAQKWLRTHDRDLKNARLRPIADEAMEIWSLLRQESNVEIAGLELEGSNTQRRVAITSRVDGDEAPGMTVLSQGELHALALALFLPRATVADSPFRFVVLDDPVQAMDPSKVDGLLDVLTRIAKRRQVVVFSHDDRLANAVRHGGVDATLVEVSREAGSRVTVRPLTDPAQRYLDDAYAMTRDENLPLPVLRRLLPGMLRMAAEAAAYDRWFARALRAGMDRDRVEDLWGDARMTKARISLAVSGTLDGIGSWHTQRPMRRDAMAILTVGNHKGLTGDPHEAYRAVRQLVTDIREAS